MSSLTIRILETRKESLDDAARRLGFTRMKDGELRGDITALLNQMADALKSKNAEEVRRFLSDRRDASDS